jgi:hypothetical protein
MAMNDSTPSMDMKECPICKQIKPLVQSKTGKRATYCRPCEIAILMAKPRNNNARGGGSGYVYLMYSTYMKLHKIGYAGDPRARMHGIGIPGLTIKHTFYTFYMGLHEEILHDLFSRQRVEKEWFDLNEDDVTEFLHLAKFLEHNGNPDNEPSWWQKKLDFEAEMRREEAAARQLKRDIKAGRVPKPKRPQQKKRLCPNCQQWFVPEQLHYDFCSMACYNDDRGFDDPDNLDAIIRRSYRGQEKYIALEKEIAELESSYEMLMELWEQMNSAMAYGPMYHNDQNVKLKRYQMFVRPRPPKRV